MLLKLDAGLNVSLSIHLDINCFQQLIPSAKTSSALINMNGSPTATTSERALVTAVLNMYGLDRLFSGAKDFPDNSKPSTVLMNKYENSWPIQQTKIITQPSINI